LQLSLQFCDTNVLQGSVMTCLGGGGIFNDNFMPFPTEYVSAKCRKLVNTALSYL